MAEVAELNELIIKGIQGLSEKEKREVLNFIEFLRIREEKSFHLELSPAAKRDLKRLPRSIQKEKAFINEPKEERSNVKSVGPKPNPTR